MARSLPRRRVFTNQLKVVGPNSVGVLRRNDAFHMRRITLPLIRPNLRIRLTRVDISRLDPFIHDDRSAPVQRMIKRGRFVPVTGVYSRSALEAGPFCSRYRYRCLQGSRSRHSPPQPLRKFRGFQRSAAREVDVQGIRVSVVVKLHGLNALSGNTLCIVTLSSSVTTRK